MKKIKNQNKKNISIDVDENIETNNNIIIEPNSRLTEEKTENLIKYL